MKPIRLHKMEKEDPLSYDADMPNKAGEVRRTFLHRSPVAKLPPTAVPVAGLPEGRIAKIRPVAKPPGKLKLVCQENGKDICINGGT